MNSRIIKLGISAALLCVAFTAIGQNASSASSAKETGACTITVYGVTPTCTSPMTLDSCNATAKKLGGVADWKPGKSCPK